MSGGAALLNTELLADKLQKLTPTQPSVEALSSWCMFFRKEVRKIVTVWKTEFNKVGPEKLIAFLYLANDLLQNGRKKSPEMCAEFFRVLPECLKIVQKKGSAKDVERAKRMVTVWGERQVYSPNAVKTLLGAFATEGSKRDAPAAANPPISKRARAESVPKGLQPFSTALVEVGKCETSSNKALAALNGPCRNNLEVDGTMEELLAAQKPLVAYTEALTGEIAARQRAMEAVKALLAAQERNISSAEQKLGLSRQHLEKVESRLKLLRESKSAGVKTEAGRKDPVEAAPAAGEGPQPAAEGAAEKGEEEYDPENP
mmetsp:Transcript_12821/g.36015  ORF Transcript_12821/g.36015 Transcript_12821/m.36015 type:complete len:316 (+) Transcript_12821:55-1002(+)